MFFFDCNVSFGTQMNLDKNMVKTADELSSHLEKAGIKKAVVWKKEQIEGLDPTLANEDISSSIKGHDNLHGLWIVVPKYTHEIPQPKDIAGQMKENHIIGLKLAPAIYKFVPKAFSIREYIEVMIESNIPLFINTQDGTSLSDTADILDKYPELTIVLTYPNIWPNDRNLRPFVGEYKNVYLDLTHCITADGIASFVNEFEASRLLYGSGFPQSYLGANMLMIRHADISNEQKHMIAGMNLQNLIDSINI